MSSRQLKRLVVASLDHQIIKPVAKVPAADVPLLPRRHVVQVHPVLVHKVLPTRRLMPPAVRAVHVRLPARLNLQGVGPS